MTSDKTLFSKKMVENLSMFEQIFQNKALFSKKMIENLSWLEQIFQNIRIILLLLMREF